MSRRRRRRLKGRHMLTLGALSLWALSGYELWIRLEDFWAWTAGVRHLSERRGTPFLEDLWIMFEAPEMRALGYKLLFLVATLIFGLICIIRRNRARGAWVLMVLNVAVAGLGLWLGLYSLHPSNWAQLLKLAPLALIMAGCVANYIHRAILKKRHRERQREDADRRREQEAA